MKTQAPTILGGAEQRAIGRSTCRGRRSLVGAAAVVALAFGPLSAAHAQTDDDWETFEDDGWETFEEESWEAPAAPAATAPTVSPEQQAASEAAVANTPVARYLQEGLAYYEADDFYSASIFFWRVVNEQGDAAATLRPRAQFELAKTLVRLGVLQGALYYFDEIIATGAAHPYFESSAPWLVVIARRLPGDLEMLRRVAAFASVFPDRIEEKYRDEMAFLLGQHFYNVGELERSLRYLGFVTDVSTYYPKALFLAGITHVRLYQAEPALGRFVRLRQIADRSRDDEVELLGELATLSMARTYYSAGDYDRSVEFYSQIEQGSAYWLDAMYESSWAHFQRDRYNRALGNLHSLNSPFFNDQYYPEAPVLQAVIFFMNCRFAQVRATLDEFTYVYQPIREELQAVIGRMTSNADYYQFLQRVADDEDGAFDPKLQTIVNATLGDRTIRNAVEFVNELDREIAFLATADPGWANSDLAQYLQREIATTRELSISDAGGLVRNRLTAIRDELLTREREGSAILVETDLAEANAISSDLRSEMFRGAADGQRREATSEEMRWTFQGEYWKDELGFYYYAITSVCR